MFYFTLFSEPVRAASSDAYSGLEVAVKLGIIPLAILLLLYSFGFEGPQYLASTGTVKAMQILQQIANTNGQSFPAGRLVGSQ